MKDSLGSGGLSIIPFPLKPVSLNNAVCSLTAANSLRTPSNSERIMVKVRIGIVVYNSLSISVETGGIFDNCCSTS